MGLCAALHEASRTGTAEKDHRIVKIIRFRQPDVWAVVGPLLLAGLGGGLVTSPNVTLTLEAVPVRMAGAAGGALQTAQRIGAAVGTALLASVFYRILTSSGHAYPKAVSDALWCACGLMLVALLLAIAELWQRRHRPTRIGPLRNPNASISTSADRSWSQPTPAPWFPGTPRDPTLEEAWVVWRAIHQPFMAAAGRTQGYEASTASSA